MPAAHLLTDTEKSSVPYKTPLKNHRERTILGVFVKLGVRTLIPISHILAISPTLEHRQVAPPQVGQQLKPHATARHARHVSNSDMIPRCGPLRTSGMEASGLASTSDFAHCVRQHPDLVSHSGLEASSLASTSGLAPRLRACETTSDLARPLQSPRNPSEMASRQWYAVRDTGASSLVRRNGKLQRHPLGLLTQTPHSVRVLLHKPRPGAPSGIGELFDAVDH